MYIDISPPLSQNTPNRVICQLWHRLLCNICWLCLFLLILACLRTHPLNLSFPN